MARATFLLMPILFKVAHNMGLCMDLHWLSDTFVPPSCNRCLQRSNSFVRSVHPVVSFAAMDRCGEDPSFVKKSFVLRC
jgi:hypothetical protein